jgi:hypothetical protein
MFITRRLTHIRIEGLKGFSPLFAYRYATTAIVVIARLIGICASGIHAAPNRVNARFRHAMLAPTISQILVVETTARFSVPQSHRQRH